MITVRQDDPGLFSIDFSGEPKFDLEEQGVELQNALFIRDIQPKRLVVEDGGQPGEVLAFIQSCLGALGYKVEFDSSLREFLNKFDTEKKIIAAVKAGKVPIRPIPKSTLAALARGLLEHQVRAVRHAITVGNGANFSVPGAGKTQVALTVFSSFKDEGDVSSMMIIGPASSFVPWQDEFEKTFGRKPNALRVVGQKYKRENLLREASKADLVLCTYQMAYRERSNLAKALRSAPFFLVLDESHYIKNIDLGPWSDTAITLAPLAARRMILSGTPAPHSLRDLWAQFTFLWPGETLLGDKYSYEQVVEAEDAADRLKTQLKPFFVRIKKSDLKLPKPDTSYPVIPVEAIPNRQRLIIRLLELKTLERARSLGLGKLDISTIKRWRRARTIRLLQAAVNPALLSTSATDLGDPGDPLDGDPVLADLLANYSKNEIPAKVHWTVNKVRELTKSGKKVVVWASFVGNLLLLKNLLGDLSPLLAYGGIPAYAEDSDPEFESRESNIQLFKTDKNYPILLANPAACSESISLHKICQDAIYLERTFNCGQFLQSLDRINRVDMPKGTKAHYHIPILTCAIEKILNNRLTERQRVLYRVLDDDMPVLGFSDDGTLLEDEDDIDAIFTEVLKEIGRSAVAKQKPGRAIGGSAARRRGR